MEKIEGLVIIIDWHDRYADNQKQYKLLFEENTDLKLIINDMKRSTRVATKDARGVVAIFVSQFIGYGKEPIDLCRYNLDLQSMNTDKIALTTDILKREREASKHESLFAMVNFVFSDINDLIKKLNKESSGKK